MKIFVMRSAAVAAVIGGVLSIGGCYASVQPAEGVYYDPAPANIETYPSVVYEGHPTYYYNNHWYYRSGNRWVNYRVEPAELQRRRGEVERAPGRVDVHENVNVRVDEQHPEERHEDRR